MRVLFGLVVALVCSVPAQAQSSRALDSFEDITAWSADASTDVTSTLSSVPGHRGDALRLDYDFNGRSGYAFAARDLSFEVPENYEISFWVRGAGPTNTFEVKFTDASGENVHWRQTTRYAFPDGWALFTIKKRQVAWAWGPKPDRTFRGAERVEFVVTAGEGGRGFIEIDDLSLRTLSPEPSVPPRPLVEASSAAGNAVAALSVDDDPLTAWVSADGGEQALTLDLGYEREFGGLTLRWANGQAASRYRVMASSDRRQWREIARVTDGDGGTDWLMTTEASARWLRLDLQQPLRPRDGSGQMGAGLGTSGPAQSVYGLTDLRVEPLAFGKDATAFLTAVAGQSRRGHYPRGFVGEQPYWTLVGVDGGGESGLISEDGAIELKRGGPSIEPFVLDNGRLVGWADVQIGQALIEDDLPIPAVTWIHDDWTLKVTAMAEGAPDAASLYGRYDLTNTSSRARTLTLALAARPMQVNGPVQFLAVPGGASPLEQIQWTGAELVLNDALRVRPLVAPDDVRLSTFQAGADPQSLIADGTDADVSRRVQSDATGLMAGSLTYTVTLAPGETRTFGWVAALAGQRPALPATGSVEAAMDTVAARVAAGWREKLDRFDLILPPEGQRIEDTMKTSLAHMLMSRQGPTLQPGTRSYNRSWIRDGAMMAEGLNRLGHADLSQDYLRWYAPYVFDNGKVPCCVDSRGADPVPENDSHGEFIFLAAETYRYTGDVTQLRSVWPQVQAAIAYMDSLRAETRVEANRTPETRHLFGLLPPSISHEGYSDRAAWSYWDDFWGLLGYRDAAFIATTLGETEAAARIEAARAEFAADVTASITGTAIHHRIDWIAGAADRGDFDATSTTIGLSPGGLQAELPQGLLIRTFEKYWENFTARAANRTDWKDYTPYELRNVGALVRLGQRERAMTALDFFFADRRPVAWNGWAEVVGRDLREPRFIGDMPHAWISSDYIRSALDMFVYERDADDALVLAAGLPMTWIASATGVGVREVRTPYGPLTYGLRRTGATTVLTLDGRTQPPGGFVLPWPEGEALPTRVRIDGRGAEWTGRDLLIPAGARRIELR
ncbi:discoidin domain-containing protein [Brevundimonas subvibrioides]|uniref:Coagulation factor 5/8 type domain protein n=1 Tax=Brevundimonas subvibrioides (strain ATCC 15264 / DSM 4735 / LMG 14903 / NBRC 16000 / CB 81) TaxID=633149 RepID=D9QJL4_BRESC|nr:discoidin domain-containing protein [Brevundimonas subvibrioides]ADL01575.1 coagulation factor 5/8 type domain protein [Brevundimonas subvibrioides ATCC 15264]